MAGGKPKKVVWRIRAKTDFADILNYIALDSVYAANKVGTDILAIIAMLPASPEIFVKDDWKYNNDGSYRVFYLYHYRVSYRVTNDAIYILRIKHTSQEPKHY